MSETPHVGYNYKAHVVRVIDGDSIVVNIDMGLYMWKHNVHIRLLGINTPEVRGQERPKGLVAKAYLENILPVGQIIGIETHKPDKYGRVLADIHLEHEDYDYYIDDLSGLMISFGYAKAYDGKGKKPPFPLNEAYPIVQNK